MPPGLLQVYMFCLHRQTFVNAIQTTHVYIEGFIRRLMAAGYVGVAVQDQDEQIVDEISQIAHEYIKVRRANCNEV